MGLPGVEINVLEGTLGGSASIDDGIAGLIVSAPAPSGLALSTPKVIFSLDEAIALGIDEDFDSDNNVDAYHQIEGFYTDASKGTELWIMVIPQTTTMESACNLNADIAKQLLEAAGGRIKIWGITRVPDAGYAPTFNEGIDDDVAAAVLNADALCESFQGAFNPCRAIIGARGFQGDVGALKDFRLNSNPFVGVVLGSESENGYPAVGRILGRMASLPVQRKISRVKDGDVGLANAYLSDGNPIGDYEFAQDAIHDKGYIFYRTIANLSGYYFSSDPACVPTTSDFSALARGRVIDKALRIAYATFIEEIEDDIEIDDNGNLSPVVAKYYQEKIVNAIDLAMQGEISDVDCYIDPAQDVLATNKVVVDRLAIRPLGYSSYIEVSLGFDNPSTS